MRRYELTDEEWALIEPLIPPPADTGRPRRDQRQMWNAILRVTRSGAHTALSIARRGYVLETGHVRLEDEATRLLQNEEVKRAYLGG